MDLLLRLLVRMAYWSRRPPSRQFIVAAGIAVALALAIGLVERFFGWPEFLTVEPLPRTPLQR
jgi:hypothetical protein